MPLVIYPTNLTLCLTVMNLKQQYNWYGQKPCLGQYYFSPVDKKYMYSSMIDNTDCYFIELCTCMGSCLSQLRVTLYAEPIDLIIIYCTQDVEHPRYTGPFNEIKTMFYAKICLTFLNEN